MSNSKRRRRRQARHRRAESRREARKASIAADRADWDRWVRQTYLERVGPDFQHKARLQFYSPEERLAVQTAERLMAAKRKRQIVLLEQRIQDWNIYG